MTVVDALRDASIEVGGDDDAADWVARTSHPGWDLVEGRLERIWHAAVRGGRPPVGGQRDAMASRRSAARG